MGTRIVIDDRGIVEEYVPEGAPKTAGGGTTTIPGYSPGSTVAHEAVRLVAVKGVDGFDINSLPATVDGITFEPGMRFWYLDDLPPVSASSGVYVYTSSGSAAEYAYDYVTNNVKYGDTWRVMTGSVVPGTMIELLNTGSVFAVGTDVPEVDIISMLGTVQSYQGTSAIRVEKIISNSTISYGLWLDPAGFKIRTSNGRNGSGSISVDNVDPTDVVVMYAPLSGVFPAEIAGFTVSGTNELWQAAQGNLSGTMYTVMILPTVQS